nr:aquaporin [Acetobacter thailandicus]
MHFKKHTEDRPLAGQPRPDRPLHWKLYGCESLATAVLIICGVVSNTLLLSTHIPLGQHLASHAVLQTALCGLCFGLSGGIAAYTRFGKVSGAHLNPSVSLAFYMYGRLTWIDTLGYILAQLIGACLGIALLMGAGALFPFWDRAMASVSFAATMPNPDVSLLWPFMSEFGTTFLLVIMIIWLLGHPALKYFSPWAAGFFFLFMNPVTAWLSGNSTNLARSFAPALASGQWHHFWIYLTAPFIGAICAMLLIRIDLFGKIHLAEARLVNFGHHGRVPRFSDPEHKSPPPVTQPPG